MDGLVSTLANLGIGGLFSVLMFRLYRETVSQNRKDSLRTQQQIRADRDSMESKLMDVNSKYADTCSKMTTAVNELTEFLQGQNGHQ